MIDNPKSQDQNLRRLVISQQETIKQQRRFIDVLEKKLRFINNFLSKKGIGHPAPPNEEDA